MEWDLLPIVRHATSRSMIDLFMLILQCGLAGLDLRIVRVRCHLINLRYQRTGAEPREAFSQESQQAPKTLTGGALSC